MSDRACSRALLGFLAVAVAGVVAVGLPDAVDDTATMYQNGSVLIDVLANDDPGSNPPIAIVDVTDPDNGTAEIENGQIRYTPDSGFHGTDTFAYTIEDNVNMQATATVTVTVHFANNPPVAEFKEFTVPTDVPLRFMLRGSDPDLDVDDPKGPERHPLAFSITRGPQNGTIEGDLEEVYYEAPNKAFVELTYRPNPSFAGTDSIQFTVTDPFGATSTASVLFEVVREYLPMGTFSGNWTARLTLRSPEPRVDRLDTNATIFYRVNGFNFQLRGNVSDSAFNALSLVGTVPLGGLATLRSTLLFDPRVPSFSYWQSVVRLTALDTDFTYTFRLSDDETRSFQQIVARGSVGGISFTSTTRFAGLGFLLDYQLITLRWNWDICELPVDARLRFTKEGFDYFHITFRDIALPCPDCTFLRLYADLRTEFTEESKTVVPVLRLRSDWECCVRGYFSLGAEDLDDGGIRIGSIAFYGYEIRLRLEGGIDFRSVTSLVSARNASVTGFSEYFEFWILNGPIPVCCGSPGRWQVATYFTEDRTELFGWGMTRFTLEFPIDRTTRIFSQLSVRSESDPWKWEWRFGWTIRW